jgi:hypothetical protein
MAIKRTTTTTISRTPPPLPADEPPQRLGGRLPSSEDNRWPDVGVEEVEPGAPAQGEVIPVGVEQLQRSQEMQAMGIHNWVAAHDERNPDYQQQAVEGVSPTMIDYGR